MQNTTADTCAQLPIQSQTLYAKVTCNQYDAQGTWTTNVFALAGCAVQPTPIQGSSCGCTLTAFGYVSVSCGGGGAQACAQAGTTGAVPSTTGAGPSISTTGVVTTTGTTTGVAVTTTGVVTTTGTTTGTPGTTTGVVTGISPPSNKSGASSLVAPVCVVAAASAFLAL
jgi:hypothetical protein